MNEKAKEIILSGLNRAFPAYPVTLQESPEDSETLWVRVFSVPPDQVRAVKDFIHALEEELPADVQVMLLPMVKNLEVTRQHYPQYLPPEAAEAVTETLRRLLNEALKPSEWQSVPVPGLLCGEWRTVPGFMAGGWCAFPVNRSFVLKEIAGDPQEAGDPANVGLAFAA